MSKFVRVTLMASVSYDVPEELIDEAKESLREDQAELTRNGWVFECQPIEEDEADIPEWALERMKEEGIDGSGLEER